MRAKRHSFLGDFAKFVQAENLEAAGIGQDRPRPGHESVQASEVADGFDSWPQIEVIGIAEKNLDAEFFENILRTALTVAAVPTGINTGVSISP